MIDPLKLMFAAALVAAIFDVAVSAADGDPDALRLGSRRELFVDHYLIDRLEGASLKMHSPQLAAISDQPPPALAYATILKDGNVYRLYTRGDRVEGNSWKTLGVEAYHANEVTLYAESKDGIHWTQPNLGLYQVQRYPNGNVILADQIGVNHNFTPFIDTRPGVAADQRYKALGGIAWQPGQAIVRTHRGPGGLKAFVSADGIRWSKLQEQAVVPEKFGTYFDSQNVSFWSEAAQRYVCYFRTSVKGLRSIGRTTSDDFIHWTDPVAMNANTPGEHLYTSGAQPYFRASQLILGLPTRFQLNRGATTDILLMSSRDGTHFDRTFMEAFIRPGLDAAAWGNRANYAALNVIPTGPTEMSIWVSPQRRYTLRIDGFVSVSAPWTGGEMVTKPFTFTGKELELNFSTSAGGAVRIEVQDAAGKAIPNFTIDDCPEIVGDKIDHIVKWKAGADLGDWAGKPIRLRFVMQDADVYSMRWK